MSPAGSDEELRVRLRQQQILVTIGALALRGGELTDLLQETTRLIASGLNTSFAKVLEYLPDERAFLVRAGVGWHEGVVGHARLGDEDSSPAGYAFKTGQAVLSNVHGDTGFRTPKLLEEHGILSMINVIIRRDQSLYGVLEADSRQENQFEPEDLAFMQAAANLVGLAIDRKTIEVELAHSHARISEVLDSISDAFYSVDHGWRFIYFNRNAEIVWRRRRSDVLGARFPDGFAQGLGSVIHEAHLRAARERRVVSVEALCPAIGRWLDVSIFPNADGLSVYMRDITERKETEAAMQAFTRILEERVAERTRELAGANSRLIDEISERKRAETALMQAQRLEAIGQLTGGIAHDFNNLLTAVIGNLELLQRTQRDERTKRQVSAALHAAQHGASLTRQLLAYARKQHVEPKPLDLGLLVNGMREMLRRSLGGLTTIEVETPADQWLAMADPVQVESIILNLAINARDAMKDGGLLRIITRNIPAGSPELPAEVDPGDYVVIAVTDEGTGMPPEVAARVFEPFFTTKDIGKGSGLGLAQVHGIATQFGGTARVHTAPGRGTTVEVFLPRAFGRAAVPDADPDPVADAIMDVHAGARILVVDDQNDVRAVATAFLEDAGFEVHQAAGGQEALQTLAQDGFALALVDHAMAGMSGLEFVRQARERYPNLRVLYVTGHTDPLDRAGIDPRDSVIAKPYSPAALLHEVWKALAA